MAPIENAPTTSEDSQKHWAALDRAVNAVNEDVEESIKRLELTNSPFDRRTYIRTVFASVETKLYRLRQELLDLLVDKLRATGAVNFYHMALLLEESPRLQNTGKVEEQVQRLPLAPLAAFTFRTCAETIGLSHDFFGDDGWRCFQQAVKIRHRLSHPKRAEDLDISDEEMKVIDRGGKWFTSVFDAIGTRRAQRFRIGAPRSGTSDKT
jgi:hypothetical protein